MSTTKIYPGMLDGNYELFHHDDELKALNQGQVISFEELPQSILKAISDLLEKEPSTRKVLEREKTLCTGSILEKFAFCRFGGLDFTPDVKVCVNKNEVIAIQDGEYWECPMRGNCAAEGVACKMPVYNGHRLTPIEVQVMKQLHTVDTNNVIAERLSIPLGTYHLIKKNLYEKLGALLTRHEVTRVADSLNIR